MRLLSILILLFCSLMLSSCGGSDVGRDLDNAEAMMNEHPDMALTLLDSIDGGSIKSKSDRARYALLKSIALDKNYVDTTTFDVLQPAIDYYEKQGTPDEKLRTYYYQGRIYYNRGEYDKALDLFLRATTLENISDSIVFAHALTALGVEYHNRYEFDECIKANLHAASIYDNFKNDRYKFRCMLNAFNGAIVIDNKAVADSVLKFFDKCVDIDSENRASLIEHRLAYLVNFGSDAEIRDYICVVEHLGALSHYGIMTLATAYDKLGQYGDALKLLEGMDEDMTQDDQLKYLAIKLTVLEEMGDYREAFDTQNKFYILQDSVDLVNIKNKTHVIEEKHRIELQAADDSRRKSTIIWGCVAGIVLLGAGVVIVSLIARSNRMQKDLARERARVSELENEKLKADRLALESEKERLETENNDLQLESDKQREESEKLSARVALLEEESRSLREVIDSHKELSREVQAVIKVRTGMLNSVLASYIASDGKCDEIFRESVEELTEDRERFMESNRLAFRASHPKFIKYFEDHGLTEREINYVCLYAIGLKGTDVGRYMQRKGHVNMSSAIRKKLGIDKHQTNIGIYVRRLLNTL